MSTLGRMKSGAVGVGYGLFAFFSGLLVMYVLKSGEAELPFGGLVDSAVPEAWQVVTWLYFSAHNVDLAVSGLNSFGTTLSLEQFPVWDGYLLILPPLVLISSGYGYARRTHLTSVSVGSTVAVAVGYLATALAMTVISTWSAPLGAATITPNPPEVLTFGSIYPLVFIPIGMVLKTIVVDEQNTPPGPAGRRRPQQPPGQPRGQHQQPAAQPRPQGRQPTAQSRTQSQQVNQGRTQPPVQRETEYAGGQHTSQQRGQQQRYTASGEQMRGRPDQQQSHRSQQPQGQPPDREGDATDETDDGVDDVSPCPRCGAVLPETPPTTCEECDTAVVPEQ